MRKSYIGVNFGHSSSACLINGDGQLKFAIEEDRLTKEKNTSKFPTNSIQLILNSHCTGDPIVWSEGWHLYRRLWHKGICHTLKYCDDRNYFKMRLEKEVKRFARGLFEYRKYGRVNFIGHHRAHAYSLLPFGLPEKSLIFVSDTIGEKESMSFFYWDGEMHFLKNYDYPNSLGSIFHQFAYHLGFQGRTAPGKLMAISGYGNPIWLDNFNEMCAFERDNFQIKQNVYPSYRLKDAPAIYYSNAKNESFKAALINCENNHLQGYDIAASTQAWFTNNSWELITRNISQFRRLGLKINNLGLAGGAALNCQANGYFLSQIQKEDIGSITVSPWSEDSGTSIGAAVSSFLTDNPFKKIPTSNAFLGPSIIKTSASCIDWNSAISTAAKAVIEGHLIALASGNLEFGPRALGGRCIIASAFLSETKERLNKCKGRPPFMPFAPAILAEDFDTLFEGKGSLNMAWTVKTKQNALTIIPGAIHVTKEARVQIVNENNTLLYKLLEEIKQQKGFGIVVLTSLNGAGQTIPVDYQDSRRTSIDLNLYAILSDNGLEMLKN